MNESVEKLPVSKRAVKNASYGFISWFIPAVLGFIATRILVLELGVEDYGIYSLIQGFIAYLFVFNTARAVTKYAAASRVEGIQKVNRIVSATFFVNLLLSVIVCAVILVTSEWVVSSVLRIENQKEQAIAGFYIMVFSIFFSMLGQPFIAVVQGVQRFDTYSRLVTFVSFVFIVGSIALAILGKGVISLLMWNLVTVFLLNFLFYFVARRLLPEMKLVQAPDFFSLKEVFRYGGFSLGYHLLANSLFLFERSWIVRHFGSEGMSYYAVPMNVGIQIHFFVTSFSQIVFPMTSEFQGDLKKVERLYTKAVKICFLVTGFLCSVFVLQADNFLSFWINEDFSRNSCTILVAHVLTYCLTALIGIAWQMFEGLGKPHFNLFSYAISFAFSLCLMVILSQSYGVLGVALGRFIGTFVLFMCVVYLEKKIFKDLSVTRLWFILFLKMAVIICFLALLGKIIRVLGLVDGVFWELVLSVFLFGFVYLILLFCLRLITQDEKDLVRSLLAR